MKAAQGTLVSVVGTRSPMTSTGHIDDLGEALQPRQLAFVEEFTLFGERPTDG